MGRLLLFMLEKSVARLARGGLVIDEPIIVTDEL